MKISYRQDLSRHFLILEEDIPYREDYRFQMILSNSIRGLLPCSVRSVDDVVRFYYDISGLESLKKKMEEAYPDAQMIRRLLLELLKLDQECSDYLLNLGDVLLEPEFIFLNDREYYFCYLPTLTGNSGEKLHDLVSSMLDQCDERDEESADLLYTLHSCTRGNYCLRDVVSRLAGVESLSGNLENEEEEEDVLESGFREEDLFVEESGDRGFLRDFLRIGVRDEEKPEREKRKKRRKERKEERHQKRVQKKEEQIRRREEQEEAYYRKEIGWSDDWNGWNGWLEGNAPENCEDDFEEDPATTYLYLDTEKPDLLLYSTDGREHIRIDETPFVIGSADRGVHGFIGSPAVSRKHARIDRDENGYTLTDLHSTNHTFLNGRCLDGEKARIRTGDRISFANRSFEVRSSIAFSGKK